MLMALSSWRLFSLVPLLADFTKASFTGSDWFAPMVSPYDRALRVIFERVGQKRGRFKRGARSRSKTPRIGK